MSQLFRLDTSFDILVKKGRKGIGKGAKVVVFKVLDANIWKFRIISERFSVFLWLTFYTSILLKIKNYI